MKIRILPILASIALLAALCACDGGSQATPSPTPTSAATFVATPPPPTATPEDMPLGFRFLYDPSQADTLPYGSLSVEQAVTRLYESVAPQSELADPEDAFFRYQRLVEIDGQACYLYTFGEQDGDARNDLSTYAVCGDGAIYEYSDASGDYVQLINALDAAEDIYTLGEGAPIVSFDVQYDKIDVIDRIDIKEPVLQSIPYERTSDVGLPQYGLYVVDANFDDYLDFRIVLNQGANGVEYAYWLWSPDALEFERTDLFDDLQNAVFDPEAQTISTFEHISASDNITATYGWDAGAPLLLQKVEQFYDIESGNFIVRTTLRQDDGSLSTTEEHLTEAELLGRLGE
jgi:hypothetical protein